MFHIDMWGQGCSRLCMGKNVYCFRLLLFVRLTVRKMVVCKKHAREVYEKVSCVFDSLHIHIWGLTFELSLSVASLVENCSEMFLVFVWVCASVFGFILAEVDWTVKRLVVVDSLFVCVVFECVLLCMSM